MRRAAAHPAELAGVLGRCGRVLAMRFHAALFALAAGVPVAGLAYDPKVPSLLAGAGLASLALPAERWRAEEVVSALRRAGEEEVRDRLTPFATDSGRSPVAVPWRRWRPSTPAPCRARRADASWTT